MQGASFNNSCTASNAGLLVYFAFVFLFFISFCLSANVAIVCTVFIGNKL